ncbi:hypothetical protein [Flavobacterium sp. JP2137]|uniref:hypothetical protein n=1 Tax=Flavobacterium sp. JP2137 TaxID=3414510 RepID=UPI003D2FE599
MKKRLLSVAFLVGAIATGYSQVGIGTQTPSESAQLDVVSSNKGILIPRIALTSKTDATTITAGNVNSLMVYNTNTAVGEGYYYWMTDKWLKVINSQDIATWTGANNINHLLSVNHVSHKLILEDDQGILVDVLLSEIFKDQEFVNAITVTHVDEIFNNTEVINNIINKLKGDYGNVFYDQATNKFQYLHNGVMVDIDWSDVVGANTTNVSLVVTTTGDLKLTDSAGNSVIVALEDIFNHAEFIEAITVNHVDEIFNNATVIETIIQNLKGDYGNVFYDQVTNKFQYLHNGVMVDIDWSAVIGANTTNVSLEVTTTGNLLLTDSANNTVHVALQDIFDHAEFIEAITVNHVEEIFNHQNVINKIAAAQPWKIQVSGEGASENTDKIYQMGTVAIGANDIPTLTIGGATQNVQFHVAGNISTTGKIYTTNSVYADYVFENYFNGHSDINEAYEFKSLEYVKDFVAKNNHLPGVTKISDLSRTEHGYAFDMTELSIQQLEKIEELYLHTIEQQDLIDKQEAEINQLKSESQTVKERLNQLENLILKISK